MPDERSRGRFYRRKLTLLEVKALGKVDFYFNKDVKLVLKNAVKRVRPDCSIWKDGAPNIPVDQAPETISVKGGKLHEDGEAGFR